VAISPIRSRHLQPQNLDLKPDIAVSKSFIGIRRKRKAPDQPVPHPHPHFRLPFFFCAFCAFLRPSFLRLASGLRFQVSGLILVSAFIFPLLPR
jgi:hypothetical protein